MKIPGSIKMIVLMTTLLSCTHVFAVESEWENQNSNLVEPDWRTENAKLEQEKANTARTNADTAAENANTAAQISNTAAQNANNYQQNANINMRMETPVPTPKEANLPPPGSVECLQIRAGWFNSIWIPEHRVCKYNQSSQGVAWIEGYWACTQYKALGNTNGVCSNWDWKPGHWVQKFSNY